MLDGGLAVVIVINLAVVGVFLWAVAREGDQLMLVKLDRDSKGHITLSDVRAFVVAHMPYVMAAAAVWPLLPGRAAGGAQPQPVNERPQNCKMHA